MKTALIFLWSMAVVLGVFAYFAVFGTGSYAVMGSSLSANPVFATSTFALATTTAPTGTAAAGGSAAASSSSATWGSTFSTPALTWPEGQAKISIMGASLQGSQLSFSLSVQAGPSLACVPLNLRLVTDEEGDVEPPDPASFTFPDSGNCNAAPGGTYDNQTATFTVDPTAFPFLLTTGGASSIYFEISTTTGNGLAVYFPSTSG
ncbi:MAG TPA: hypothetical protein VMT81_00845 [Candidatus Paceibacterota bacterium]|nr:hypothetical protein [Candidatus Paceibacterota bacterium]